MKVIKDIVQCFPTVAFQFYFRKKKCEVMIKRIIYTLIFLSFFGNLIAQTPSIGGYNVYYGHLHNHNAIGPSYAAGSHDDAYNYARNVAGLDYFGTSNHWIYLTDPEWDSIKTVSDKYNEDGEFTAFWGFEYESFGGDLTIIHTEDYSSIVSDSLCPWLETQNGLAFINHPYGVHYALFDSSTPCDRVVGMELFNKTDGFDVYYYPVNYFAEVNLRGWKIGASGSDDNHQGTWGTRTDWRMAILSKHLSRPELFEAMQARRFYSTLDKNLALSFKMDTSEMGSTIGSGVHNVQIQARDNDGELFTRVMLFKNGKEMYTWGAKTPSVDITVPYITYSPVCSLTFPQNTSHFTSPQLITLTAEASDADGTVTRVEFFVNGDSIGTDTLAPYSVEYTIPEEGYYEVNAKATDDLGSWGVSSSCFFTAGDYAKSVSSRIADGGDDYSSYYCERESPWGVSWILCTDDCSVFLGDLNSERGE
jgi:hypothetical protein